MTTTTESVKSKFSFLDQYDIGEFTLKINSLTGQPSDKLAAEIRQSIINKFISLNPLLCKVYDFEIEESEVVYGSRKSRNKGKLKKKKGKTFGERIRNGFNGFLLALTLTSTDYKKIPENFRDAVEFVESIFKNKPNDINIEDLKTYPIDDKLDKKGNPDEPNIT
jgi:hypothetical protein